MIQGLVAAAAVVHEDGIHLGAAKFMVKEDCGRSGFDQGYGIARPMPAKDMPAWVNGWPNADWLEVINGTLSH